MPLLKAKAPEISNTTPQTVATDVISEGTPKQQEQVVAVKKSVAKAASSETMTKADWASKDQRISRQGLFQACLQSVGLLQLNTGNTLEDYLTLVEQAAERGLQFVNKA